MNKQIEEKILSYVQTLIDDSTQTVPAWNITYNYEKSKRPSWNYVDGCMMKAMTDLYLATHDKKYIDFANYFNGYYVQEDGSILGYTIEEYNIDHINGAKPLFELYEVTKEPRYKLALDMLRKQLNAHPRTKSSNFFHKKIYPNQIWLDGLYMCMPFYARWEKQYNNKEGYTDIFNQFKNVATLLIDHKTGLYYHAYDESREMFWCDKATGLSPNFWTRAMGWYAMSIVDTLEVIGDDPEWFDQLVALQINLKELIDALLNVMDKKHKMWFQVTNKAHKSGNYLETSGSCAIAYTLMKGARLRALPKYYHTWGKQIFDSIIEHKLVFESDKLVLKDICLVAGLGGIPGRGSYKLRDGTFEYYISEPIVNNDAKGVAPFLFAYAEILREQQIL